MRWRWGFILLVLGVSLIAVCVETVVMAATGAMRFGPLYQETAWRGPVDEGWPRKPDGLMRARNMLIDADRFQAQAPPERTGGTWRLYFRTEIHVGWPLRCAEYDRTYASRPPGDPLGSWFTDEPPSAWRHGLVVPRWLRWAHDDQAVASETRRIPLRPIWPGLVVNTLVNACVIGPLMLVPGWVRRRWRRRHGRCVGCGYSRAGLGGGVACPECGGGKAEG
ncbi:MAG: hypothetical protein ACREJO_02915 [Phycisphaerales bacterium]